MTTQNIQESYFERNFQNIRFLKKGNKEIFKQKLERLEKKGVKFLAECALNIRKGIIPLEGKRLVNARKLKDLYKTLTVKSLNLEGKRKFLLRNLDFAKQIVNIVFDFLENE
jgi:hypothetical protein